MLWGNMDTAKHGLPQEGACFTHGDLRSINKNRILFSGMSGFDMSTFAVIHILGTPLKLNRTHRTAPESHGHLSLSWLASPTGSLFCSSILARCFGAQTQSGSRV